MSAALAIAVYLNHCYVAPDRDSFDAAASDPFLSTLFAPFERRTTRRTDKTYTGLYYYGAHTYFELLEPGKGFSQAGSGIAFGVEEPGAIAQLGKPEPITRALDGQQLPWFQVAGDGDDFAGSGLTTWIMEYDPRFLARFYPQLPPKQPGIARAQILERYVARLGQPRALFEDITRLEIALTPADAAAFARHCERLGYAVQRDDHSFACTGPDLVLHVTPATAPARLGIAKVTFRLRAPAPQREARRLGSSTLELDGQTAVWRFTH